MTPLEYFRVVAKEFSCIDDATVNQWIVIAGNYTDVECLGEEKGAMAQALYAAHLIFVSNNGSLSSGQVKRKKEGDLEIEYFGTGNSGASQGYLMQTIYGQQFLEATRACFGSSIMTRGGSS
jgi:hypothetical protein